MYKNKKSGAIGIVVTVIILILLVVLSNINIDKLSVVENIFSTIVMPFQNGFTMLKNKISGNDTFFTIRISFLSEINVVFKFRTSRIILFVSVFCSINFLRLLLFCI